jgi:hypothetical protein
MKPESFYVKWIVVISLAIGLLAALLQWQLENDVVLTAVIATATVAYAGLTWRLVHSAEQDRRERRAQDSAILNNTFRAVLVELQQNKLRRGQTQAFYTHVPFEHSALDAARPWRAGLPELLANALHEVENRIARYNAVARYNESQVRMGSGAADSELQRLSSEVDDSLVVAIDQLNNYLRSLAT